MAAKKQYASADNYERKLERIMERFGATEYDYNFDRHGAWVQFRMRGQLYRFDHTLEKAKAGPQPLTYGSDCFAQIVLALEDLARMAERGIYELSTWLEGMKFLPPPVVVPECFRILGFEQIPESAEEIRARFKALVKEAHPDTGGNNEAFIKLNTAQTQALEYINDNTPGGR